MNLLELNHAVSVFGILVLLTLHLLMVAVVAWCSWRDPVRRAR